MRSPTLWIVATVVVIVTSATIPSCYTGQAGPADDPTVVADVYSETESMIRSMQQEVILMEQKAITSPLSPSEAAELARSKARLAGMQRLLDQSKTDAAAADRQPDAGDVVKGFTSLLPPPFNIPTGIVVGGVAEWIRTRKKRTSFNRLVSALDKVKANNTDFAGALNRVGPALRLELGTDARNVIAKMRNGKGG